MQITRYAARDGDGGFLTEAANGDARATAAAARDKLTSAILLPAVLAWSEADETAARRQRQLLAEIGLKGGLAQVLAEYISAVGQPQRLYTVGVRRDLAQDLMVMLQHPSVSGNLRNSKAKRMFSPSSKGLGSFDFRPQFSCYRLQLVVGLRSSD